MVRLYSMNILGAGCSCKQDNINSKCELHSEHGGGDSGQHRAHEPEIQKASQVAIEGIKEPTALINRLTAVCYLNILLLIPFYGY